MGFSVGFAVGGVGLVGDLVGDAVGVRVVNKAYESLPRPEPVAAAPGLHKNLEQYLAETKYVIALHLGNSARHSAWHVARSFGFHCATLEHPSDVVYRTPA